MNQSDQNTPAKQELVIEDSAQVAATPGLGLAKGIIAILLGVISFGGLFVIALIVGFAATVEPWYGISGGRVAMIIVAFLLPPISFGLCLWRGIVAIRKRKVRRVTYLNFCLWAGVFVLVGIPLLSVVGWLFGPLLSIPPLFPDSIAFEWTPLVALLVPIVLLVVAIALGIYLDRRRRQAGVSKTGKTRLMRIIGACIVVVIVVVVIVPRLYAVPQHELTLDSTSGGSVTTPGECTHAYDDGAVVSLLATPNAGYQFANWSGDADTVSSIGITATTVTMDGNYHITANFAEYTPVIFHPMRVAAGWDHTVGLKSDGTVIAAGRNISGQCIVGNWTDIVQVAAGYDHTVGLKSDGTVIAAGDNYSAQCDVGGWTGIVQVDAGSSHTVGLKRDGTLVAVGANWYGQCAVTNWTDMVQVAAGGSHTVGLKSDGTVVAVGENDYGQCDVGGWTGIVQVAAGQYHTVGLKSDGTAVAVGSNAYGQWDVGGWTDIVLVAASGWHTVGLRSDGTVIAAGSNYSGQCNVGNWTDIVQVAAGYDHTVGLRSDGTVVATGLEVELDRWNLLEAVP